MQWNGIQTGVDFERFIMKGLMEAGLVVSDTPVSNDYGADLIFEYRGFRFVGQCKYYSSAVGLQAVQEVNGALRVYNAQYGIVFTNSTFTQQAYNLASVNNILLIDGERLCEFEYTADGIPMFDQFIRQYNGNEIIYSQQSDWVLNDLVGRYGISSQKIIKDCISRGLPHYKVGREYRFIPQKVKRWEIEQQGIPVGQKGWMELPGFRAYKFAKIRQYKQAKKRGDTITARQIKKELRQRRVSVSPIKDFFVKFLLLILLAVGSFLLLMHFSGHDVGQWFTSLLQLP